MQADLWIYFCQVTTPTKKAMKKITLSVILMCAMTFAFGQSSVKSPGIMLGLDSTLIIMEYSRFNNLSTDETWEKHSAPGRIIYYCNNAKDKNKLNVAHVYEFDENGINIRYTTVAAQEKIKYAVDHFNTLALGRKNVYKFVGVIEDNKAVWVSNDEVAEVADCNCGNVVVTMISNLKKDNELAENTGVKPGRSGELLAIVYTPNQ